MTIEIEQEEDGRWLSEVIEVPGAVAYGPSRQASIANVQSLCLRVLADRWEHGEDVPDLRHLFSIVDGSA